MAEFQAFTEEAPAHWASYLINGDASGLEDDDQAECDAWLEGLAASYPDGFGIVDCGEPYIGRFHGLLTELCDYTLLTHATDLNNTEW